MGEPVGQVVPLSLGRRVVCDFLQLSRKLPMVTIQKEMTILDVVAARQRLLVRPSWCAIFTKAYGKVVAARQDLRRAYHSIPWEHLFEYKHVTADVVIESCVNDENVLVTVPLKQPENRPLLEIDGYLTLCKEEPIERVGRYRQARRLARFPRLVRNWVWWYALNVSRHTRSKFFGTYGVTSVANSGVESLRQLAPWSTLLHYGTIGADGKVAVRLTYNHRVHDGSQCGSENVWIRGKKERMFHTLPIGRNRPKPPADPAFIHKLRH